MENVPLVRYVEKDKLESLKNAKKIGIKLLDHKDVLAIIENPTVEPYISENIPNFIVMKAGKIELTKAAFNAKT